uniref:Uncharacterized protein n=1 Tax=Arundo donax TaxID=35708 RepID=A0A0A9GWD6_ARUDO
MLLKHNAIKKRLLIVTRHINGSLQRYVYLNALYGSIHTHTHKEKNSHAYRLPTV